MREWLSLVTEYAVVLLHAIATLIIVFGTLEALLGALPMMVSRTRRPTGDVWVRYARWLIAGLTVLLAADVLETMVRTTWEAVGQLGAIAVIRTFLNYFLNRDIIETRESQDVASAPSRERMSHLDEQRPRGGETRR